MTKNQILKRIAKAEKRISEERDALRLLIQHLEDLEDDCDTAARDLEAAADTLSKYL